MRLDDELDGPQVLVEPQVTTRVTSQEPVRLFHRRIHAGMVREVATRRRRPSVASSHTISRVTIIAVPIFVDAPDDTTALLERARVAVAEGAGMIEWRIDLFAGLDAAEAMTAVDELVLNSPAPCIVTCRSPREG